MLLSLLAGLNWNKEKTMPWIQRNEAGEIVGMFANPQPGYAEEWVDENVIPAESENYTAVIAKERYTRETAGVVVAGISVLTDRDTQSKLTAAAVRAQRDNNYTVDWKGADGKFVSLTASEIIVVADGVDDYVQACYSREAELLLNLAKGTYSEAMLVEGWP